MRGRRSPVVARKLRAVLRTPAGVDDPDIHLTTEYEHPLVTEAIWTTSRDSLGTVIETEAEHA